MPQTINDSDSDLKPTYLLLDRKGGSTSLDAQQAKDWTPEEGILWIHLDSTKKETRKILRNDPLIPEIICEGLLEDQSRPRMIAQPEGLFLVLRGVNTNPGQDPEDMVSIRLWIEKDRIVSTRRRRLLSIADIRKSLVNGKGPKTTGDFLCCLVERIADRIGDVVDRIEAAIGKAEEDLLTGASEQLRRDLSSQRRQTASIRRFLAPQRDALDRINRSKTFLAAEDADWLREEADRITRYLEDLDLAREQAVVVQEEFLAIMAQQQNARMYVLSVVTAIFLPLSFATGLLGMNVGGLPGLESPSGFLWSAVIMISIAIGLVSFFKFKKWL